MRNSHANSVPDRDIIIVGAGTSGLSLAFHLKQQGVQPTILEASQEAGSAWRARHPQLRLNTHRWLSALPGKPLSRKLGTFVARDDYLDYLNQYADWLSQHHGVEIQYGVTVRHIEKQDDIWRIHTNREPVTTRRLVLATGPERIPYTPCWPGRKTCQIEQRHAADFGDVGDYRDKRVLIVGGANSGIDIANSLVRAGECESLAISMRQGTHLLPTRLLGIPSQLTAPALTLLPLRLQDKVGALLSRLCFGDLEKWGIRTPPTGICTRLVKEGTAPGFDDGFVAAVKTGRMQVYPDIKCFNTHSVTFVDGSMLECDVVIFATGYRTGLSDLTGDQDVTPFINQDNSNARESVTNQPGFWIFGMQPRLEGNIYARTKEARRLAPEIAGIEPNGDLP